MTIARHTLFFVGLEPFERAADTVLELPRSETQRCTLADVLVRVQEAPSAAVVVGPDVGDSAESLLAALAADRVPVLAVGTSALDNARLIAAGAWIAIPDEVSLRWKRLMVERLLDLLDDRERDQKRLADAEASAAALRAHMRGLREWSQQLAHEIRTPLGTIRGFGSNLRDGIDGPLTGDQRESVGYILSAVDQLAALVDRDGTPNLPAASQTGPPDAAAQRRRGARTREDIAQLVHVVVGQFQVAARAADHILVAEIDDPVPLAWMDRIRITQVLSNLLSNAIKFTPAGGLVRVLVGRGGGDKSGARSEREVRISVCDTGPGIPDDARERVFDRYVRLDSPGEVPGSGIGLAVCRDIVRAHGGRIWADRAEGGGAAFHVVLPTDARARRLGSQVLLVQDPRILRSLLDTAALSSTGGRPEWVLPTTVDEALRPLLSGEASIVLTDGAQLDPLVLEGEGLAEAVLLAARP